MDAADENKVRIKSEFRRRRRNQYLLVIPLIPLVVLACLSEAKSAVIPIPREVAGPVLVVLALGAFGYTLYNWRCPACSGYLGKGSSPKFCPKCGAELS